MILALHLLGQGEEGLRFLLGAVDQLGRDAVIGDDGEAVALERGAKLFGKALGVAIRVEQRDGGDGLCGCERVHGREFCALSVQSMAAGSLSGRGPARLPPRVRGAAGAGAGRLRRPRGGAGTATAARSRGGSAGEGRAHQVGQRAGEQRLRPRRRSLPLIGPSRGTAIWIAIELNCEAAQHEGDDRHRHRSRRLHLLRSAKATNSFSTTLVPNRLPAWPASFHGTLSMYMTGWKILPRISWKLSSG